MAISHESISNNILTLERGQTMAISEEELLYRWLYCSGSKASSDRHFNAYYQAVTGANKTWLTFLHGKFRKNPRIANEMIQEVFCRLTARFANRPQAARRIKELAPTLSLPALGDIHQRRTKDWGVTTADWAGRSMQLFQQHYDASIGNVATEEPRERTLAFNDELTNELPPLRIKGAQLISWALQKQGDKFEVSDDRFNQMNEEPIEMGEYPHSEIARLVKQVKQWLKIEEESKTDERLEVVGGAVFIRDTGDILELLPKLTIPYKIELNFYLFRVADNLVTDYYRDPFNKVEGFPDVNEQEGSDTYTIPEDQDKQYRERRKQEGQNLLLDVYAILEAPVKEAEAALLEANGKNERRQAAIDLEKAQQRYAEDMLLFEFWLRDDYTREKMSEQLHLDRKTVAKRLNKLWEQLSPLKN